MWRWTYILLKPHSTTSWFLEKNAGVMIIWKKNQSCRTFFSFFFLRPLSLIRRSSIQNIWRFAELRGGTCRSRGAMAFQRFASENWPPKKCRKPGAFRRIGVRIGAVYGMSSQHWPHVLYGYIPSMVKIFKTLECRRYWVLWWVAFAVFDMKLHGMPWWYRTYAILGKTYSCHKQFIDPYTPDFLNVDIENWHIWEKQ